MSSKLIRMGVLFVASGVVAAAGIAGAQTAAFSSEFGIGTQDTDVTNLQTFLTQQGDYSGPITGYFGTLTQAGVETFQTAQGISATGYVGPLTLAALNRLDVTTTSSNAAEITALRAELEALLSQIQALETASSSIPTGSSISLNTVENASVSGTLSGSGVGPYTFAIASNPSEGSITSFNSSTGAFTYMPSSNFSGSDSFTYTVGNSSGTSAPMTVTIVTEGSTATTTPAGESMNFETVNDAATSGTLGATGMGPFTFEIVTNPIYGTLSNVSTTTGAFTYTPQSGYTGGDSFTYTVGNGSATSSASTVTINNQA